MYTISTGPFIRLILWPSKPDMKNNHRRRLSHKKGIKWDSKRNTHSNKSDILKKGKNSPSRRFNQRFESNSSTSIPKHEQVIKKWVSNSLLTIFPSLQPPVRGITGLTLSKIIGHIFYPLRSFSRKEEMPCQLTGHFLLKKTSLLWFNHFNRRIARFI